MIALDLSDKIRGDASAATVVDFTLHGIVGTTVTQLADGQLALAIGDLYTAGVAGIAVTGVVLVNTDTVARTVNLYLTPSAGTARRLIPKDMSLGAGYSLHYDGQKIMVLDTSGQLLSTWAVDDTPVDGETSQPISSNWAYDHVAAADPHTGYRLESADHTHQTTGLQAGKLDHGLALDGLTDDDHTQYILKTLLDAESILYAITDNTPAALTVAASRIVGRGAAGDIAALTGAQVMAILSGQAAATFDINSHEFSNTSELLRSFFKESVPFGPFSYVSGWTSTLVGSGAFNGYPTYGRVRTGVTASSSSHLSALLLGASAAGVTADAITFTKKLAIMFMVSRNTSDTEAVTYVQIKAATTIADLVAAGIGIKINNFTLLGESYGSARGEVNLSTTMASFEAYPILILFDPASKVEWYVRGALAGTQSTAANLPSGNPNAQVNISIKNGATGGVQAELYISPILILKEA